MSHCIAFVSNMKSCSYQYQVEFSLLILDLFFFLTHCLWEICGIRLPMKKLPNKWTTTSSCISFAIKWYITDLCGCDTCFDFTIRCSEFPCIFNDTVVFPHEFIHFYEYKLTYNDTRFLNCVSMLKDVKVVKKSMTWSCSVNSLSIFVFKSHLLFVSFSKMIHVDLRDSYAISSKKINEILLCYAKNTSSTQFEFQCTHSWWEQKIFLNFGLK